MRTLWIAGLLLALRISVFAQSLQENAALLAVARWGLSGSHCSGADKGDLEVAEVFLRAGGDGSAKQDRLLERIAHFRDLCESKAPVDVMRFCLSPGQTPLLLRRIDQPLSGEEGWILSDYWLDTIAIELNEPVPVVLAWESSDPGLLNALREKQLVTTPDGTWCGWREGNTLWQVGVARNRVWNGGFEWDLLEYLDVPSHFTTNLMDHEIGEGWIFVGTVSDVAEAPTQVACLRGGGQSYVALYQILPLAAGEALYIQGGTARTEAGARADIGGSLELPSVRLPAFAARLANTAGDWLPFAQLVEPPEGATEFSFRVANSGIAGTACFDDLFVLPIAHPGSLARQ